MEIGNNYNENTIIMKTLIAVEIAPFKIISMDRKNPNDNNNEMIISTIK